MTGETLGSLAASVGYLAEQLVGAQFAEPADIARLQVCLSAFPSVQGMDLQDSSDNS